MKSYYIITGASRGLGQAIAEELARDSAGALESADDECRFCLISRSEEGLQETSEALLRHQAKPSGANIQVQIIPTDLSNLDKLDGVIDQVISDVQEGEQKILFDRVVFVNNAGSLGHVGPLSSMATSSLKELELATNLNVTSSLWWSTRISKAFGSTSKSTTIVNVSSLCAVQPFPTMATYCMGKAARDMFHSAMAKEMKDNHNIKILNYAPGALQTDMTDVLRLQSPDLDEGLLKQYELAHEEGNLISPKSSARKLVRLLKDSAFESGQHIDYWDIYKDGNESEAGAETVAVT